MKKLFFFATLIAATTFGLTSCSDSNGGDSPNGGDGEGVTAYLRVNLNPVGTAAGVASSKPFLRQTTYTNNHTKDGAYKDGEENEGSINNVRFYFFKNDGSAYTLTGQGTNNNGQTNTDINNYLDITSWNVSATPDDVTTIERKTDGVLVINGTSEEMPAKIVALVNLDAAAKTSLGTGALSENTLLNKAKTLEKYTMDGTNKENFIMSSTAYLDGTNVVQSSIITSSNYAATADAARNANPVQLYVERLAARVDVNKGSNNAWGTVSAGEASDVATENSDIYTLTTGKDLSYIDNSGETNNRVSKDQIYVLIQGWGLADENNNAPVLKSLATSYNNLASSADGVTNTIVNQPLSVAAYHRSFWETANGYTPIRYTFNQYAGVNTTAASGEGFATNNDAYHKKLGEKAYTFPNTPTFDDGSTYQGWNNNNKVTYTWNETNRRTAAPATTQTPTKVLVAGKLLYKGDNDKFQAATICTYAGNNYLGEESVKKAIATDLFNSVNNKLCTRTEVTDDNGTTYTYSAIDANDIVFVASGEPGSNMSYKLTPKIKTDNGVIPSGKAYYTYNTSSQQYEQVTDIKDINGEDGNTEKPGKLKSVAGNNITIYKDGNTYYYTTLQHLWFPSNFALTNADTQPDNVGAWGVVRNHLYNVTINDIQGWGTPVYDPDKIIIPVTPTDNQSYLGAQINVLMWRVVNQSVDLNGQPVNN